MTNRLGGRPRDRGAQDGAAVIANQRRRIAVKPIVERAEGIPAEPIQILPAHDRRLDARRHAGAQQRRARAGSRRSAESRVLGASIVPSARLSPRPPAGPPRRAPPHERLPARRAARRARARSAWTTWFAGTTNRGDVWSPARVVRVVPARSRCANDTRGVDRTQQPQPRPAPAAARCFACRSRVRATNARSLYDEAMPNARAASCQRVPPSDGAENAS